MTIHPYEVEMSEDKPISSMRKIKSIDQLYGEVKDCSLVITNDAALATALNKMIDKPMIGAFAMTPQQIASMCAVENLGRPIMSELKVAMEVHEETEIDFRTVHSTIQYIQEVRRYTLEVESHLYTNEQRAIYESYKGMPTLERAMEKFNPENCDLYRRNGRIAVIGLAIDFEYDQRIGDLRLYNDLERRVLPPNYDEIIFYDGTDVKIDNFVPYNIDTIYQIGNDRQIAENAVDLIEKDNATDYAIVLKSDSPLADAVKASLYRKGIPFVNSLTVKDLNQVRDFIEFISLALSFETIRVGDIRELFSTLNYIIPEKIDEHLVSKERFDDLGKYSSDKMEECRLFMKDMRKKTFDEVRKFIYSNDNSSSVKILIDDLAIADKKVGMTLLSRVIYAVDNVNDLHHNEQIPKDEKEGVLLVDCGNSVYIDRPIVIYLGMEQDWNLDLTNKKYVPDKVNEMKIAAVRLEMLLQQGEKRFYLVNTSKDGEEPRPCLSFDDLFLRPVKSFNDICNNIVRASWADSSKKNGDDNLPVSPEAQPYDNNLSQSALSQYYRCPRAFMFHSLVPSDENEKMEFGNIIHEFAELYATHKDVVEQNGLDMYIEKACDRFSGITTPMTNKLDRCKIECAIRNVKAFIDSLAIGDVDLDKPMEAGDNYFFGCIEPRIEQSSTMCETDRGCDNLHIHGKMDLCTKDAIIDYKTGKAKSGKEIVKVMDYEKPSEHPDFQPMVYLAMGRELGVSKGEFDLFYAMDNDSQSGAGNYDVRQNIRRVCIVDGSDIDFIKDSRFEDVARKGIKSNATFQIDIPLFLKSICDLVEGPVSSWYDQIRIVRQSVMSAFKQVHKRDIKESTADNAINTIFDIVKKGIAGGERTVLIRTSALDAFLEEIDRRYSEIKDMSVKEFKADPKIDCIKCDYYSICTKDEVKIEEGGEEQ